MKKNSTSIKDSWENIKSKAGIKKTSKPTPKTHEVKKTSEKGIGVNEDGVTNWDGLVEKGNNTNWLGLLSFKAARDPELAPHAYLMYLLLWTLVVGLFVLFLFPLLGKTIGFVIIAVLIVVFVYQVWYFHINDLFAD